MLFGPTGVIGPPAPCPVVWEQLNAPGLVLRKQQRVEEPVPRTVLQMAQNIALPLKDVPVRSNVVCP